MTDTEERPEENRHVVVCEGERDTTFLAAVVDQSRCEQTVTCVDIGSKPTDPLVSHETNELKQFDRPWTPGDLLLKSEGGYDNVVAAFPRLVTTFRRLDASLAMLLDLDGDGVGELLADLGAGLDDRYPGEQLELQPTVGPIERTCFQSTVVTVRRDETDLFSFPLLAFQTNLETAAGVDKSADDPETMDDTVRAFAADDRVRRVVVEHLL